MPSVCFDGSVDEDRRVVDRGHELAQGVDRVVDRVGDGARDVLGHGRLHGQVAVGEARQLVEQPQNRLLIALVLLGLRSGGAGGSRARGSRRTSSRPRSPAPRTRAAAASGYRDRRGRLQRSRRRSRDSVSAGRPRQSSNSRTAASAASQRFRGAADLRGSTGARARAARRSSRPRPADRRARRPRRARCLRRASRARTGRGSPARRSAARPSRATGADGAERADLLQQRLDGQLEPREVRLIGRQVGGAARRSRRWRRQLTGLARARPRRTRAASSAASCGRDSITLSRLRSMRCHSAASFAKAACVVARSLVRRDGAAQGRDRGATRRPTHRTTLRSPSTAALASVRAA